MTFLAADEESFKRSLYHLEEGCTLREITDEIDCGDQRKCYVFTYPSDGMEIKSMISFVPSAEKKPLLLVLRGASRMEALPAFMPGQTVTLFAAKTDAIIVLGTLRDGVSEGVEEYGGADLNDVARLSAYLPAIASKLGIQVDRDNQFLIGPSRGGMQMFLALAKFPELQGTFKKFVSLSGLLNTHLSLVRNPGWKEKMSIKFGFNGSEEWLDQRSAVLALANIERKDLPFLIIQGTADPTICLEEGYSMLDAMHEHGFSNVMYWEVKGGDHCLKNHPEYISLIMDWLLL